MLIPGEIDQVRCIDSGIVVIQGFFHTRWPLRQYLKSMLRACSHYRK